MDICNKGVERRKILCEYYFDEFLARLNRKIYEAGLYDYNTMHIRMMKEKTCVDYFDMMIRERTFKDVSVSLHVDHGCYALVELKR